jgi:single-stranded-DNA-specific exonuclease
MTQPDRAFLNVTQSLTGRRWVDRLTMAQAGEAERLKQEGRHAPLLARILAGRGVTVDGAESYLAPTLRDLMPDPSTLTDMDKAVDRLAKAIRDHERVAIFGDYDVDGATSAALMKLYLDAFGVESEIYIPDRVFEGYGPNPAAIRELVERGAKLIVTVDCGSVSHEPLAVAKNAGVDVVVLDHHQTGETLPQVDALVNPNREDDLSGQGHLCAAGVVFLTLVGLQRQMRAEGKSGPDLRHWLDLVALGTVCDVVPLTGLNRAFVARGLEVMRAQHNEGLAALARVARQDGPPAPWHLGFLIGPRINAGGRIGNAALGAELLTTSDPQKAAEIAERLDMLNNERKAMETAMLNEAIAEADAEIGSGPGPGVLVTASETWHAGVVGLLASRLKDRFRRPAFAVAFDDRGIGSGSARSVHGIDIGRTVRDAVEEGLLQKGGGHAMAAGITIEKAKLGAFRGWIEEKLGDAVRQRQATDALKIDGALSARAMNPDFFDTLQSAGPFGAGNSNPVVALPNHTLTSAGVVGQNHVRVSLRSPDGATIAGIAFRAAETPLGDMLIKNMRKRVHVVGTMNENLYRGSRKIELRIIDIADPETV